MKKLQSLYSCTIALIALFCIVISIIGLISCNSKPNKKAHNGVATLTKKKGAYVSYEEAELLNFKKSPRNATIALGFILGEPKTQALHKLQNLIDAKKVIQYTDDVKFQLEKQGFKDIPDYVYTLIANDTVDVDLSIDLGFDDDKLSSLYLTSYGSPSGDFNKDFNDVLGFMIKKFGGSQLIKIDSNAGYETHYWFDGYKQISICNYTRYTFYYRLTYTDLRTQVARKNQKRIADNLFISKEAEKRNKEKIQKQDDIK